MLNKSFCLIVCCFLSPHVFSSNDDCQEEFSTKLPAALALPLEEVELSVRATNALRSEGIYYIGDLASKTQEEILKIQGIGEKSLEEIEEKLAEQGLQLGMNIVLLLRPEQREAMIKQYKQESSPPPSKKSPAGESPYPPMYDMFSINSGFVSGEPLSDREISSAPVSKEEQVPSVLTPKEEKVLRMLFGVGKEQPHSYKKTGQVFNIGTHQVRMVRNRALRKLSHFGFFNLGYLKSITSKGALSSEQVEVLLEKQNSAPDSLFLAQPVEHFVGNSVQNIGIRYLGDLLIKTEEELSAIPGFEGEDLAAVKSQLSTKGLYLGMNFLDWPSNPAQAEARVQKLNPRPKVSLTTLLAYPIEKLTLFSDERSTIRFRMDPKIRESLKEADIIYLGDLIARTPEELLKIPKIGRAKLVQTEKKLAKRGLQLGADVDWPKDRQKVEELVAKLNPGVELSPVFTASIKNLKFSSADRSIQITYILTDRGLFYLGDLVQMTPDEVLRISGIGESLLGEIENALSKLDLRLGMNIDWPSNRQQIEELVTKWNPSTMERPILYDSLKKLGFSTKLIKTFRETGIIYLGDLVQMTPKEILKIPGVGKAKLAEIEQKLSEKGLHLDMNISWPSDRQKVNQMALEWGKRNPFTQIKPDRRFAWVIRWLGFSNKTNKILKANNILYLGDLVTKTPEELLSLSGLGKAGLGEIENAVTKRDLELGMNIDWPSNRQKVGELIKEL